METAYNPLGSVSSGTMAPDDCAVAFADACETIGGMYGLAPWGGDIEARNRWHDRFGDAWDRLYPNDDGSAETDYETLCEIVDDLTDLLEEVAPPYMYFGSHPGDGAEFGFWPCMESIDELPRYDFLPDNLPGEDFVVVTDHGNLSVYGADGKLLWDCV